MQKQLTPQGGIPFPQETIMVSVRLLVDLLLNGLGSLCLLGLEERAQPRESLVADDQNGGHGRLSMGVDGGLLLLGELAAVDLNDVVAALDSQIVGDKDDGLGLVVKIAGGLLDDGEALIELGQALVAERIGLGDVGRNILIGLGNPGGHEGGDSLEG